MYKYLNLNPLKRSEEDCVIRAIALATDRSYAEIYDKLYYVSRLLDLPYNCVCSYSFLLGEVFGFSRVYVPESITIGDFAQANTDGVYLVRAKGHLTCIIDGVIYDIFNCSDMYITDCWYVDEEDEW